MPGFLERLHTLWAALQLRLRGGAREATQKEVADLLGISQSYISRLEKRIIAHLRQEMLKQMQC